jgi:H+/Cl- antiporter ClcA
MCKYFSKRATGSGLPEFKAILSGDMKGGDTTRFFATRVLVAKVTGLILATGSSLSIGSEGPLIHISACIAHFLMRNISDFNDVLDSPSLTKQILAASAAVGVSSAFNAPVGGLLFSVEITSTFYLISNYYKSFIAAMAGSFACNLFLITQHNTAKGSVVVLRMLMSDNPYTKWELVIFLLMGVGFGYFAHYYLELNQQVGAFMKPYCKSRPMVVGFIIAVITCMVIFGTGAYNEKGMRVISLTSDVFTTGEVSEMHRLLPMYPLLGLVVSVISRCFLTLIATNLPIPAGIFVPNFLIGGIVGRFIGHLVRSSLAGHPEAAAIHLPGYALVGSTAFAAGVTHTISVGTYAQTHTMPRDDSLPYLLYYFAN